MASKSLYVGNLSYSVTESTLRELFAEYEPTEARLIPDKGFGFVDCLLYTSPSPRDRS